MQIQDLRDRNLIIFEGIAGSQAYGIATPTSDTDIRGVFIQPLEDILSFGYQEQVADQTNDIVFYEVGRFLSLLADNNPNILELLNMPEDCILIKTSLFDKILAHKEKFISRTCKNSFGGYAVQQIKKARGMNKKIAKPMEKQRKEVLDFCYVPDGQGSIPVKEYLAERGMKQEHCGLVSLPHMRYVYAVYYDKLSQIETRVDLEICSALRYKGIVQDEAKSNDISLSSILKGENVEFIMYFNKDGYSIYCREYKEYWDWVEKRNPHRYADNLSHGGGYDGKNLAHCHRLLDMAIEIGEGKGINVRRENREELLSIRRGEKEYATLLAEAESKIEKMDSIFDKSELPERADKEFANALLKEIRKEAYGLIGIDTENLYFNKEKT
jgi:hypothetical protein